MNRCSDCAFLARNKTCWVNPIPRSKDTTPGCSSFLSRQLRLRSR